MMKNLLLSAASGVFMCAALAIAPTIASPTITPVSQNRSVSASAHVQYRDHPAVNHSQTFFAPDFLLFDKTAVASADDAAIGASAASWQRSEWTDTLIVADGTATFHTAATAYTPNGGACDSSGGSGFELTFSVDEPIVAHLSGQLSAELFGTNYALLSGFGSCSYSLTMQGGSTLAGGTIDVRYMRESAMLPIETQLPLVAGTYTLRAATSAHGSAYTNDGAATANGVYSIRLEALPDPVPEPLGIALVGMLATLVCRRARSS
jgi:hypothetical protein